MKQYMIYGANGFTAELIARAARLAGHAPVLAGRREAVVRALANELGLPYRIFSLDDVRQVVTGLNGMHLVLNAAGPFNQTSRAMVDACLQQGIHYLDISGEYAVFDALAARSKQAKQSGVMLLPGVGFDVVPSDCLSAHLKQRLPTATQLSLALEIDMKMSKGTAMTTIEGFGKPSMIRRNGMLTPVPMGSVVRQVNFGRGAKTVVALPLADVASAYYSTGIPNVATYVPLPWLARMGMRMSNVIAPILRMTVLQALLKQVAKLTQTGPDETHRKKGQSWVWGEVSDGKQTLVSRLVAPDHYDMTVNFALGAISQVLQGHYSPGYQTPSTAFGADFVLGFAGVQRFDD